MATGRLRIKTDVDFDFWHRRAAMMRYLHRGATSPPQEEGGNSDGQSSSVDNDDTKGGSAQPAKLDISHGSMPIIQVSSTDSPAPLGPPTAPWINLFNGASSADLAMKTYNASSAFRTRLETFELGDVNGWAEGDTIYGKSVYWYSGVGLGPIGPMPMNLPIGTGATGDWQLEWEYMPPHVGTYTGTRHIDMAIMRLVYDWSSVDGDLIIGNILILPGEAHYEATMDDVWTKFRLLIRNSKTPLEATFDFKFQRWDGSEWLDIGEWNLSGLSDEGTDMHEFLLDLALDNRDDDPSWSESEKTAHHGTIYDSWDYSQHVRNVRWKLGHT